MAVKVINVVIQLRRNTTEGWEANKTYTPVVGEPCYDIDRHTLRVGDGVSTYDNLPEIGSEATGTAADLVSMWDAINKKADAATTLGGYGITDAMTATDITTAINTAVANAGFIPSAFVAVTQIPDAADAEDGILYLMENTTTGHYDAYVKIDGNMVLLVDSSASADIPGATKEKLGLVKGSDAENGIAINDDYTMTVNSVNVNKLVQTDGDKLVLYCGDSTTSVI